MPLLRLPSWWTGFWHTPLRVERLALMRILLAGFLLLDQLLYTLPRFADFYGPEGVAYAGLHDRMQLICWRWTMFFFNTDYLPVLYFVFALWVLSTFLFMIGWKTRWMGFAVWFLTMCFAYRNYYTLNAGDDIMQMGLFLLLFGRTGNAVSVDAWLARRAGNPLPVLIFAWPVRLIQIQMCMLYMTTGLCKVFGTYDGTLESLWESEWWDGTAVYYTLNSAAMARWSLAEFSVPFWITAAATYVSLWWEVLFPLLMLHRWTRYPALVFGVLFHVGIFIAVDVGMFSFYTLSYYAVWVPCSFWIRREQVRSPMLLSSLRGFARPVAG